MWKGPEDVSGESSIRNLGGKRKTANGREESIQAEFVNQGNKILVQKPLHSKESIDLSRLGI